MSKFSLERVSISAVCHVQLVRHAEELRGHVATGELFGTLVEGEAEVTGVLPFPDPERLSTKEELEGMERKYDEQLRAFSLDTTNIGCYLVCYKHNFWDALDAVRLYEVSVILCRSTSSPASSWSSTSRPAAAAPVRTGPTACASPSPAPTASAGSSCGTSSTVARTLFVRSPWASRKTNCSRQWCSWTSHSSWQASASGGGVTRLTTD